MTTMLAPTAPPLDVVTAPASGRPRLRLVRYEPEPGSGGCDPSLPEPPAPRPAEPVTSTAELTEARRCAARVLRLALEVLDGRRPPGHLTGHFEAPVLRYWRVATHQRQVRAPARFSRMRLCLPRSGVAEVALACDIDGRVRALAARFERAEEPRTRWRCTALRLG